MKITREELPTNELINRVTIEDNALRLFFIVER
jgi:hypothetical protein